MTSAYDAAKNPFSSQGNFGGLFSHSQALTTDDATDQATYVKVMATADGNLKITPARNDDADTVTFTGIKAGFVCPFLVRRLWTTGTTCSPIGVPSQVY